MLLYAAWQHFELIRFGYRLEQLQQERAAEEQVNRHLKLQMQSLSGRSASSRSPARS